MTTPVQNQRVLMTRIRKIEEKQAERFPQLLERLDRIEQSIVALVDRLKALENRQNASMYNIKYPSMDDTEMNYSGAFESDIKE
ncbi:uncharacterized protein METZ01_LOCUS259092 [marine metagenome]|uniref:Uncharacterized protein n=1 Tax=marine metagenome TaxID=408172 RepID=A0A382J364_9ZZZZ